MALRGMILDCLMYVEGFIDFGEDVDELGQEDMLDNGEYRLSPKSVPLLTSSATQHVHVPRRLSTLSSYTSGITEEARY